MSDVKYYETGTLGEGSICISEEVIASIISVAALEVSGVSSLSLGSNNELIDKLVGKGSQKGVKLQINGDIAEISVYISVGFGFVIEEVAKAVQVKAKSAVESMTSLEVSALNVYVTAIDFAYSEDKS